MSNPFDQFAVDLQTALPAGAPGSAPPQAPDGGNPFASVFSDAPAAPAPPADNKPVMNSFQQPAPPMGNGMMGQQQQAPPSMGDMGMGMQGNGNMGMMDNNISSSNHQWVWV